MKATMLIWKKIKVVCVLNEPWLLFGKWIIRSHKENVVSV